MGKKPEQARLRLTRGDYEFGVTLTAAALEFRNVRLPKTVAEGDEGDDPEALEGRILERIGLFEELSSLVNDLFRKFIQVRSSAQWPVELEKVRRWVQHGIN